MENNTQNQDQSADVSENKTEEAPASKKFSLPKIPISKLKKFIPVLIIILLLVGLYFAKGLFIAALVNGSPVSRLRVLSNLEKTQGKDVLETLIEESLVEQQARKDNLAVTQDEIFAEFAKIEEQLKTQNTTLDAALAQINMTRGDLERQVRLQKLREKIVLPNVPEIAEEEVNQYIEANKDYFPQDTDQELLKTQVKEQLRMEKVSAAYQQWITEARQNARINYFVNY